MHRLIWALTLFVSLAACTAKPDIEDDLLSDRKLNLEEFFAGHLVAYGQFQDVFGTVRRRFTVDINGTWNGKVLTLVEDFVYDDASSEQRVWSLTKTSEDSWTGSAPGVIGTAKGQERGDTFNWRYEIDLPTQDGTLRVTFDDWMWLLSDDRLLNRAYMKRFGVGIGEVFITFEKRS